MTVIDGSTNDHDGTNDGRAVVTLVPFGPYNITMTAIPTGYNVLGNTTTYTVHPTNFNNTVVFRVVPVGYNLTTLPAMTITSAPDLNGSTLTTWMSTYDAHQHNGTLPTSQINAVQQLPPILSAGNANQAAINSAINNQATVQLDTNFGTQTDPTTIIKTLGVPTYSMPKSSNIISVIPSIVAQDSNLNTPTQTVTTPPFDKVVSGQQMIIPVNTNVIPLTGGLKKLEIQSASTATSTGNPASDWFVVKVNDQLPSSKPALPQNDKLTLYVNVTYQYEATHTGFDWSKPANFASPPKLTLQLPKNPSGVQTDSNGCTVSDIFVYDTVNNSWTTNPVTILSATPSADNSNTCDVVVQAQHFSQFALGGHSTGGSSTTSSSTTSSSTGGTGGAGGAVGVGPSGATSTGTSSSSGEGFGGILTPNLKIYQVSYNICNNDTVKIIIGTDSGAHPTVILRTMSGIIQAQVSNDQPYTQENVNATIQKTVYVAHIDPKETSFEVVVLEAMGKNINTVGKTIEINGCSETLTFGNEIPITQPAQIDLSAPQIFNVKFQIGNGTKVLSSDVTNQYIDSQPMTVYSIINSPTSIDRAELRFVKLGDDISKYAAVSMNVVPLQISNTTYIITGVIPKEMAQAPAITYWIHVQNQAGKSTDSDQYSIGVKPSYSAQGKLEVDILTARAEGTTATPIAYFTNTGKPVFGTVSLIADNNTVYSSVPQMFGSGQTAVDLKWKTRSEERRVGKE